MGNATRGSFEATMDHSDIRGLITALHRSVAGLPRSSVGDHPEGCPHSPAEGSPHRVPRIALPIRCVAGQLMILTPDRFRFMGEWVDQVSMLTCWPMLQTKPVSSRAIATQTLLGCRPRAVSRR